MGSGVLLIILSGLPGVGKTTIARELAMTIGAVHVRIDSIEQALRRCGLAVEAEGYAVGYAVAEDNLRLGRTVIADSVNPWPLTRDAWRSVANRAAVPCLDVEIVCSNRETHRRRVESRVADIPGHSGPSWQDVIGRDYHPWDGERLVIDSARADVSDSVRTILAALTSTRTEDS